MGTNATAAGVDAFRALFIMLWEELWGEHGIES